MHIGDGECLVKTLTLTHLYCEPPPHAPQAASGSNALPQFVVSTQPGPVSGQASRWGAHCRPPVLRTLPPQVQMGNVRLALGPVLYEAEPTLPAFPVEAQLGLGMGATVLIAAVLLLTLMYR